MRPGNLLIGSSPEVGAAPALFAATGPRVRNGTFHGPRFLGLRGEPAPSWRAPRARNSVAADRLWAASVRDLRRTSAACAGSQPSAEPPLEPYGDIRHSGETRAATLEQGWRPAVIRVLVVDDDFMVARLHSTLVDRTPGFTVAGVAHSGREALRAARNLAPDLVLLDIYLPDIAGLDVLRELRGGEAAGDPDVLVVTASRDTETVRGAQRGGAVQYIIKPFEGHLLQDRLRHYAEERQELAALIAPGQDDVDRLFGGGRNHAPAHGPVPPASSSRTAGGPSRGTEYPKGLTPQTAALVRDTLRECTDGEGLSASECAERSGLSRVSSRRYLEYFVGTGSAEVTLRYGATGRPERRYHPINGHTATFEGSPGERAR